jgi:hypothetical protein
MSTVTGFIMKPGWFPFLSVFTVASCSIQIVNEWPPRGPYDGGAGAAIVRARVRRSSATVPQSKPHNAMAMVISHG